MPVAVNTLCKKDLVNQGETKGNACASASGNNNVANKNVPFMAHHVGVTSKRGLLLLVACPLAGLGDLNGLASVSVFHVVHLGLIKSKIRV